MTNMWPFNIDVMICKMHPSMSFMEMQGLVNIMDVVIEDFQIHEVL